MDDSFLILSSRNLLSLSSYVEKPMTKRLLGLLMVVGLMVNVTAEADRVHVHLHYTADNLDTESVHMFVVEDGLQTEFHIFDDSHKIALALNR